MRRTFDGIKMLKLIKWRSNVKTMFKNHDSRLFLMTIIMYNEENLILLRV